MPAKTHERHQFGGSTLPYPPLEEGIVNKMEWTRSDTLGLANPHCAYCHGLGLKDSREKSSEPCNCVLRQIFRACYKEFRACASQEPRMTESNLDQDANGSKNYNYGRKDQEYVADFCLLTRRSLNESDYRIFKYHFLLGADWRLCCRKLKMDRGTFFHQLYRIEAKLGRVYRETEPYGIFPVYDYFNGPKKDVVRPSRLAFKVRPIRPPLLPHKPVDTAQLLKTA